MWILKGIAQKLNGKPTRAKISWLILALMGSPLVPTPKCRDLPLRGSFRAKQGSLWAL
jgi:hypothetical protein